MPVRKFRSLEAMKQPHWREPGDPELYRAMRDIWEFSRLTSNIRFKPGVYKYRSVAEFDADRIRER
jgi:hypothetical protein